MHAAVRVCVAAPDTATVTSPSPIVHVPEKVGVVFGDGVVTTFNVTAGAVVSTVKLTAAVDDEFVASSDCEATTE